MRGRCGLWDWDLARGRMFWSRSMFEIVGLEPRDALLGFGEVSRLIHPDDGDLMALAESLYEAGEATVDQHVPHAPCRRTLDLAARPRRAGRPGVAASRI